MSPKQTGSRFVRFRGLLGVGVRRVIERARGSESRRIWLSISGVAVAIALMLVVTSVGLGLAAQSTVQSDGVNYWIVPESNDATTAVISTGGPQFGRVHAAAAHVQSDERVDYATPLLIQILRVETSTSEEPQYVLGVGVIPDESTDSVAGLSTAGLEPGDPYYANGSYDGEWTGDVVLSSGAAELLNASSGSQLHSLTTANATGPLMVRNVTDADAGTGMGQLPIALFRLSELQTLTGADSGDRADQILVGTDAPGMRSELAGLYSHSSVVTSSGLSASQVSSSDLPLAVSVTAFIVALVVGTLFVGTTMGLEIVADRQRLAVLAAIGFRGRDRALLVIVQTLFITLLGGVAGIVLSILGMKVANVLVAEYLVSQAVATFHPFLIAYGVAVAVLIGLLAAPYLLFMIRRTKTIEELSY